MEKTYACGECGASGVKLYRPYGEFFRSERVKCGGHVPAEQAGVYVPLVTDARDGSVWGYTSSPSEAIAVWEALPDVEQEVRCRD